MQHNQLLHIVVLTRLLLLMMIDLSKHENLGTCPSPLNLIKDNGEYMFKKAHNLKEPIVFLGTMVKV